MISQQQLCMVSFGEQNLFEIINHPKMCRKVMCCQPCICVDITLDSCAQWWSELNLSCAGSWLAWLSSLRLLFSVISNDNMWATSVHIIAILDSYSLPSNASDCKRALLMHYICRLETTHMPRTPQPLQHISMVSGQKGPTRHAYAWQIGPFWRDTLDFRCLPGDVAKTESFHKSLMNPLSD